MQNRDTNSFTAGEFASIVGVSKQTLIFYDNIGLFSPQTVGENGYRYYHLSQFDLLATIQVLKEIGMPLREIARFLSVRNARELMALFRKQRQAISAHIDKLSRISMLMEDKLRLIGSTEGLDIEKIRVVHQPQERLKLSACFEKLTQKEQLSAIAKLNRYRIQNQLHCGRALGGIVANPGPDVTCAQTTYLYYYTVLDHDCADETDLYIKKEGDYLIAFHSGDYRTTHRTYPRIFAYAKEHHLRLADRFYEESLIDEVAENDPANYLTQISVQILP